MYANGYPVVDDPEPYRSLFQSATQRYNLPPGLLETVARVESNFNPNAVSHANAQGIMQIVPRWHPEVQNPFDPEEAIPYGARYLRELHDQFGNWELAVAAYNAGPGNVRKYGGIPPFEETRNYVRKIGASIDLHTGETRQMSFAPLPGAQQRENRYQTMQQLGYLPPPPTMERGNTGETQQLLGQLGYQRRDGTEYGYMAGLDPTRMTVEARNTLIQDTTALERVSNYRYLHAPDADRQTMEEFDQQLAEMSAPERGLLYQIGADVAESFNPFRAGISRRERLFRTANIGSLALPLGFAARVPGLLKAFPAIRAATTTRRGQVAIAAGSEGVLAGGLEALRGDTEEREAAIVTQSLVAGALGGTLGLVVGHASRAARIARSDEILKRFQDPAALVSGQSPLLTEPFAIIPTGDPGFTDNVLVRLNQAMTNEAERLGLRTMPVKWNEMDALLVPGVDQHTAASLAETVGARRYLTQDGYTDLSSGLRYPLDPANSKFGTAVNPDLDDFLLLDPGNRNTLFAPKIFKDAPVRLSAKGPVGEGVERLDSIYDQASRRGPGQNLWERFTNFDSRPMLSKMYRNVVRDIHGVEEIQRFLREGDALGAENVSKMLELLRTRYSSWTEAAVMRGVYKGMVQGVGEDGVTPSMQTVAPGLRDIWGKLTPDEFVDFERYGTARRIAQIARDLGDKKALQSIPRVNGRAVMTPADARAYIAASPKKLDDVFNQTMDWQNAVLRETLLDAGVITEAQYKAITGAQALLPRGVTGAPGRAATAAQKAAAAPAPRTPEIAQMQKLLDDAHLTRKTGEEPTNRMLNVFSDEMLDLDFASGFPLLRGQMDRTVNRDIFKQLFQDMDPAALKAAFSSPERYRQFHTAFNRAAQDIGQPFVAKGFKPDTRAYERAFKKAGDELGIDFSKIPRVAEDAIEGAYMGPAARAGAALEGIDDLEKLLNGGSLARVNTTTGEMFFNDAAIEMDFALGFPYLRGLLKSATSSQKAEVFKDIDPWKLQEAFGDAATYRRFIQEHEKAHLALGHKRTAGLASDEAIGMERAANRAAFEKLGIEEATLRLDASAGSGVVRDSVPWTRAGAASTRSVDESAASFMGAIDPVKRIVKKASEEAAFVPWTEELIRRTSQYARMADQQRAIQMVGDMLLRSVREGDDGVAALARLGLRKVPRIPGKVADNIGGMDALLADLSGDVLNRASKAIKAGTTAPTQGFRDDGFIRIREGDGFSWYEVTDQALWDGIKSLGPKEMGVMQDIGRFAAIPSATLRAGITMGFNFLAKNPIRDVLFGFVNMGLNPMAPVRGLSSLLKKDEFYAAWEVTGGPRSALVSLDRQSIGNLIRDMTNQGGVMRNIVQPRQWLDALQALSEGMENTTRLGMFKQEWHRMVKAGVDPSDAAIEAALASKHVSVNFSMQGAHSLTTFARQTMTFWNAVAQGGDQLARSAHRDPMGFMMRGGALTVASAALYAHNRKDEEYRHGIPRWEKDLFWHIRMPSAEGDGDWLRFPKPFEPGILFATLPERFLEALDDNDPEALEAHFRRNLQDMGAAFLPTPGRITAISPFLENMKNESSFTGSPIVPEGLQDIDPDFHQGGRQSAVATGIARWMNRNKDAPGDKISPLQIDNVLRGWTGELGRFAYSELPEALYDGFRGAMNGQDLDPRRTMREGGRRLPGIAAFYSSFPYASQNEQDVFTMAEKIRVAVTTAEALQQSMELDTYADYIIENMQTLASAPAAEAAVAYVAQMRETQQAILSNPDLSTEMKRQHIMTLNLQKNKSLRAMAVVLEQTFGQNPWP